MIAVLIIGATGVRGQEVISREAMLKAKIMAVLVKLANLNLVKWPPDVAPGEGMPVRIGVLGNDPFQQGGTDHLRRELAGLEVEIENFAETGDYQPCHILVVSEAADLAPALEECAKQHSLVVAQSPGLAKQGAVINLVFEPRLNRIQMEINPDSAKEAGLTIDPRVYRLAMVKIVR
jgi:hypothetical protein